MQSLVLGHDYSQDIELEEDREAQDVLVGGVPFSTHAQPAILGPTLLSAQLKETIVRCMAPDIYDRPALSELVTLCETRVHTAHAARAAANADVLLAVQQMALDAPLDGPDAGF